MANSREIGELIDSVANGGLGECERCGMDHRGSYLVVTENGQEQLCGYHYGVVKGYVR